MKLETGNSRQPVTTNINTLWANQTILVDYKQCSSLTIRCGVVLVQLPYHKHTQLKLPNQKCYATMRTIDVDLNVSILYSRNVQSSLLVHRKALQAAVSSQKHNNSTLQKFLQNTNRAYFQRYAYSTQTHLP